MKAGSGMIAVELTGGVEATRRFVEVYSALDLKLYGSPWQDDLLQYIYSLPKPDVSTSSSIHPTVFPSPHPVQYSAQSSA